MTELGAGRDDRHPVDLRCSVIVFRGDSVLLGGRTDRVDDFWVLPEGTPRRGDGGVAAARREVAEETGLRVSSEGVAFVLEASSWHRGHHRMEVVFLGKDDSPVADPQRVEDHLEPEFVALADLDATALRPPIAGYIRGFAWSRRATAPYLANLWRADSSDGVAAGTEV
jgi:8-oxo-dGTP pyrophosphatase MutT (NUDIX family)